MHEIPSTRETASGMPAGLCGGVCTRFRPLHLPDLQVLKGLLGKGHDIPVAIKAVHENTSASQRKSLLQEISLLRNLRHSNIVTLFGACHEVHCQAQKETVASCHLCAQ